MHANQGRTLLIAFGFGAIVGAAAAGAETLAPGATVSPEGFAAYALIGGVATVLSRLVLGRLHDGSAGPRAAAVTLTAFAAIEILYLINVRFLPGEYYLSARSLAFDVLGLVAPMVVATVLLRARGLRDARRRWEAPMAWSGAAVLAAVIALLVAATPRASAGSRIERASGPNVLLVVLDSARRDHLGLYGYGRPTSPSLDALAPGARVYENAYAAAPWTVPSVAQLMTGHVDGTPAARTMAELLASRGYATACFTDNPHMGRSSPLLRGFATVERSVGSWRHVLRGTVLGNAVERVDPGSDHDLVDRARDFLARTPGPVFVYLHLMDSHTPYRFSPIDGRHSTGRRIEFPITGMSITDDEAADVVARYDAGVRHAAEEAARFVREARNGGRPFLAVVTADHGESLGEGGRWFHGGSLASELLAIPLLVTGEGTTPGRVTAPVGHEAVRTTILAAAGASDEEAADLRRDATFGVVEGGLPPELAYRVADHYQVIVDRRTGERHLFQLADVARVHDLATEHPELTTVLAQGLTPGQAPSIPLADVRERLRAIGYVD